MNKPIFQAFLALIKPEHKICPPNYYPDHRYFIFKDHIQAVECYVLQTTSGTCLNRGSWYYYHCAETGNFVASYNRGVKEPKEKERIVKADLKALIKAVYPELKIA